MATRKKPQSSRSRTRPGAKSSLQVTHAEDGSASLHATGAAVVAGIMVVSHLAALVVAPHRGAGIAILFGALIGLGAGWLLRAVGTGRLDLRKVLGESELRAVRNKDGRLDLQGVEAAAWPLAILIVALVQYLLAPATWWILATSFLVAALGYPLVAWYVHQRRTMAPAPPGTS